MVCVSKIEHRCEKPGCGAALVIDGNMRNAGYAVYDGLPGRVRTGCPNSPDYLSPYCGLHKPSVALRQCVSVQEDSMEEECSQTVKEGNHDLLGIIISKRITRKNTLYQVSAICKKIINAHFYKKV